MVILVKRNFVQIITEVIWIILVCGCVTRESIPDKEFVLVHDAIGFVRLS